MARLNGVEKQLGRVPIIYTGVIWREQFNAANFPNLPDMNAYPLMTAHPQFAAPNPTATGEVLHGWSDYAIWQYAENKRKGDSGSQQWGIDPYLEPETATFDGIDYDVLQRHDLEPARPGRHWASGSCVDWDRSVHRSLGH